MRTLRRSNRETPEDGIGITLKCEGQRYQHCPSADHDQQKGKIMTNTIEATTATVDSQILWPTADELDQEHQVGSQYYERKRTYILLIPADESNSGKIEILTHRDDGTPAPLYEGRWKSLGSYSGNAVGATLLDTLKSLESEIVAAAKSDERDWTVPEFDESRIAHWWPASEWAADEFENMACEAHIKGIDSVKKGIQGQLDNICPALDGFDVTGVEELISSLKERAEEIEEEEE